MILIDGAAVWGLKATHGFPLDFALMELARRGYVPTWGALIQSARKDGANIPRLIRELKFYVREAYPAGVAKTINAKLEVIS